MLIDVKILKQIEDYCKINNINDVEKEVNKILVKGFNIVRFGNSPFDNKVSQEKIPQVEEKSKDIEIKQQEPIMSDEKTETAIEEPKKKKVRIIKN